MKKSFLIVMAAAALLVCTSCNGLRTVQKAKSFSMTPDFVKMDMNFDNMQLLGTTTISIETRTYLGIFTAVDKVNGETFIRRNQPSATLAGDGLQVCGNMHYALVKVLDEYPNADYYVPVSTTTTTNKLFLGKAQTKTMVVKAYKYNTK